MHSDHSFRPKIHPGMREGEEASEEDGSCGSVVAQYRWHFAMTGADQL